MPAPPPATNPPGLSRWWVYQRERFPLLAHGIPIATFSGSAVCYSWLLRGGVGSPRWESIVVAFAFALLLFLQLRIADEFKDFDDDRQHRPYRPVPRGLVTLHELAWVGVGTAVVQALLAVWLAPPLLALLAGVWLFVALMGVEFFARAWLKRRPVATLVSHMVVVPLIDFLATACDWLPAQGTPPAGLGWFVVASYFNGLGIEVGRKLRAPADEEAGVFTYSKGWGVRVAVAVWLGVLLVAAACAVGAMAVIGVAWAGVASLGCLWVITAAVAVLFLRSQKPKSGKWVEIMAGVWTVGLYLTVGILPLAWRVVPTL